MKVGSVHVWRDDPFAVYLTYLGGDPTYPNKGVFGYQFFDMEWQSGLFPIISGDGLVSPFPCSQQSEDDINRVIAALLDFAIHGGPYSEGHRRWIACRSYDLTPIQVALEESLDE